MKSIIQGAVLVFLVAGKSFSRGAQFWKKYVIAPFCKRQTGIFAGLQGLRGGKHTYVRRYLLGFVHMS